MTDRNYNCDFHFKIVLAIYLILILYVFSQDNVGMDVKVGVLIFFYFMLYIDYVIDTSITSTTPNTTSIKSKSEGFNSDGFYSSKEHYSRPLNRLQYEPLNQAACSQSCKTHRSSQSNQPLSKRQKEIEKLNNNRCSEGHFYVNCHKCGRDRVLEDQSDYNNYKLNKKINRFLQNEAICSSMGICPPIEEKKMSYFNTHYVDSDKIFSNGFVGPRGYTKPFEKSLLFSNDGNLIDAYDKNIARIQTYGKDAYEKPYDGTYVYWPTIDNPINGPPYV